MTEKSAEPLGGAGNLDCSKFEGELLQEDKVTDEFRMFWRHSQQIQQQFNLQMD